MPATIEVFISKDGKISIDVKGVEDASCVELTKVLQESLGEVEDIDRKPQFYQELDSIKQYVNEE
jgi:5'(3')-deoxyribonucleotidase